MINLLTGLRVSRKILLIIAIPLTALMVTSAILIYQEYQNSSRLYKLEKLLQFAPMLTGLAHELQKERGLSIGYLSSEGQSDVTRKLKEQYLITSQFRDSLDLIIARANKTDYGPEFTKLIEKAVLNLKIIDTKRIKIRKHSISLNETTEYYTTAIASFHEVVSRMAILSNNAAIQRQIINYTSFLQAKEYMGLERAQGLAGFSRGQFLPENHKKLVTLLGQQEAMLATFRKLATTEQLAHYNSKVPSSLIEKVASMRDIAIKKTNQLEDTSEITGIQWFDAITRKIDLMKIVEIKLSEDLQLLSASLASESNETLNQFGIWLFVIITVSGTIALLVGHNLSSSIGNTTKQMNLLATNDLSVEVTGSDRKDELGDMAKAVQIFKENAIENRRLEAEIIEQKDENIKAIKKAQEKALSVERETVAKTTELANSLRDARDVQQDAIDNITEGFILWDQDDRLIMCNSMFKSIYRELEDILSTGLRFEDFIRAAYQRGVYETVEDDFEQAIELRVKRHRKEDNPIEERLASGRCIRVTKGPASDGRIVGIVTDITNSKNLMIDLENKSREAAKSNNELIRSNEDLARSNADLEQFAYVASHDLKAPLRAIDKLAQFIDEDSFDDLSEDSRSNIRLLRGRVGRLDSLLAGLLRYAQTGRDEKQTVPFDTGALVREVVDLLNPPASIRIDISKNLPQITSNPTPLQQIFHNLIGNAIKHHDQDDGTIKIICRESDSHLEFQVSDDGPGISEKYHGKIFQMFQTLKRRDEVEGSGIGLAVVEKLVRNNGGEITVKSSAGERGTTFCFTWKKQQHFGEDKNAA